MSERWAVRSVELVVFLLCLGIGLEIAGACAPAHAPDQATLNAYAYDAAALAFIALDQATAAELDKRGSAGRELAAETLVNELHGVRDELAGIRGTLAGGRAMPWAELGKATAALLLAIEHARAFGVAVPSTVQEGAELAARSAKASGGP